MGSDGRGNLVKMKTTSKCIDDNRKCSTRLTICIVVVTITLFAHDNHVVAGQFGGGVWRGASTIDEGVALVTTPKARGFIGGSVLDTVTDKVSTGTNTRELTQVQRFDNLA